MIHLLIPSKRGLFLVGCLLLFGRFGVAQTPESLYNQGYYSLAKSLFLQLERSYPPASTFEKSYAGGYVILCNIALRCEGLEEEIAEYIERYPTSILIQPIFFEQAKYFFEQEQYNKALPYFLQCHYARFTPEERSELAFKTGYSAFQTGDFGVAHRYFNRVSDEKIRSYDTPATYYAAYINYLNKDFDEAIAGFSRTLNDPRFSQASPYYLLQSRFLLRQYEQVVGDGEELYQRSSDREQVGIARILAESFYALNRPKEALQYFETYRKETPELSRYDNYLAGVIHYTLQNYAQSAVFFETTALVSDSLGQNALYYLGETYIQTKNKLAALNAFRLASSISYDTSIEEDAFFNFAKLSFDLNGNIGAFNAYMDRYPDTQKANEIQSYIADAYLLNKDYRSALPALQAISNPQKPTLEKLQRASLLRALQLLEAGSYREAESLFDAAIEAEAPLAGVRQLAAYWKAECLYRSGRYHDAINQWNRFLGMDPSSPSSAERTTVPYHIAYAWFGLEEYPQAAQSFKTYLSRGNQHTLTYFADAQCRLGDCFFLEKNYLQAIEHYALATGSNGFPTDYSLYQTALAQGLLFKPNQKIASLHRMMSSYPHSPLQPAANFELGRTYLQTGDYATAETIFLNLIANSDTTFFYTKALVELGLIQINLKQPDRAMAFYKKVLEEFPESPEADNALAGIENIYQEKNDARGYFDYLAQLGRESGKTADQQEQMMFDAGERLFLNGAYTEALKSFRDLLKQYPDGSQNAQTHFYIAECLLQNGKDEEAADAYLTAMRNGSGSFAEQAILQYARISYRLEKFEEARKGYETLSEIALLEKNKAEAEIGKSRSYYKEQRFEQAAAQAQKTVQIKGLPPSVTQELTYIEAKSLQTLGQQEPAISLFQKLASETYTPLGAESAYILIQNAYNSGNFDQAEEQIYALSDSDSPQHYWIALSFIILGDIYTERGEFEQALATYQSLLDEYKPAEPDNIHDIVRVQIQKCNLKKSAK
ncbi:MAG: tetratricopeptide repeat protein [Bacteroidetes bacterium]|nr:tetratricopeptide repeat protein [Bacteroidota bacterium]